MLFGLGMGALLVVIGGLTYWLAPIVGPNPIFGVRVGYAYASREAWDKTNRFGGALIAVVGIGTAMVGLGLQLLNISPKDGMGILTGAMLVALLLATGSMFAYARSVGQATPMAHELVPVRFRWAYIAPVLVTFALLVAFVVYIYPTLPANRVPSHFNINDQPDGWQSRDEFMATFLGMSVLFLALNALVVFIATREPMIAFSRWGTSWRLSPERGLILVGLALSLVNLIFIALLWNIGWLVTRGALAFSFWWILWMIVPLIIAMVALFFLLGAKETASHLRMEK